MDGENWLYLILSAMGVWLGRLQLAMSQLAEKYVPRTQIDARLGSERSERKEDMREIKAQLQLILDKVEAKADK